MDNLDNDIKRILVQGSSGIGDLISHTPMLHALRRNFPKAEITFLAKKRSFYQLKEYYNFINKVIEIPENSKLLDYARIIFSIRKIKYDLFVRCTPEYNFLTVVQTLFLYHIIRSKRKIRSENENLFNVLFRKNKFTKNVVEAELDILKDNGIKVKKSDYHLNPNFFLNRRKGNKKYKKILEEYNLKNQDFVVTVHVGARKVWHTVLWPASRWAKLLDFLIGKYKAEIFLVGGADDLKETQKITRLTKERVRNFCGKLNIGETVLLIKRCNLFMSTNSGPMWIAAALHKPQIALCGATLSQWDPYSKNAIVVRNIIARRGCNPPCNRRICRYKDNVCMKSISVKEVIKSLEKIDEK